MGDKGGNRLSSRKTFFFKRVLPPLLVVWGALTFSFSVFEDTNANGLLYIELALPFAMAIAAGVIVYLFTRKLADDVLDHKDHLLIARDNDQERVPFSNIINVNLSSTVASIPLITLRLAKPGKFGSEIVFLPIANFGLSVSEKNPVAEELIERAYGARSKAGV